MRVARRFSPVFMTAGPLLDGLHSRSFYRERLRFLMEISRSCQNSRRCGAGPFRIRSTICRSGRKFRGPWTSVARSSLSRRITGTPPEGLRLSMVSSSFSGREAGSWNSTQATKQSFPGTGSAPKASLWVRAEMRMRVRSRGQQAVAHAVPSVNGPGCAQRHVFIDHESTRVLAPPSGWSHAETLRMRRGGEGVMEAG